MRESLSERKARVRKAHLEAEKARYLAMPDQPFRLIKDWDDDPIVKWEGMIEDRRLKGRYLVHICYDGDYPYERPQVVPQDTSIRNCRHQTPTAVGSDKPGQICLFQDHLNDWDVGMSCQEIIERAIRWFQAFEQEKLATEPAPPEIERYYPLQSWEGPRIIISERLALVETRDAGDFFVFKTVSGQLAFFALESPNWTEEMVRFAHIMAPTDPIDKETLQRGTWYRVDTEPFPVPLSATDLVRFIGAHSTSKQVSERTLCADCLKAAPELVALCYPVASGEMHWLIYRLNFKTPTVKHGVVAGFRPKTQHQMVLAQNRGALLQVYRTSHLTRQTLFRRVSDPKLQTLERGTVLVLGCGTVGSRVAETLVKSGLGHLVLVDKDRLEVGNVCRHVLGVRYLTQNKAIALRDYLLERNPFLNVEAYDADIVTGEPWLSRAVESADVVVSCIGNDAIERWVNESGMVLFKPVLFCRTYAHATIGEVLLARPHEGCFACLTDYLHDPGCPIPQPPSLTFNELVSFDTDCGAPFIPASAVDIDLVALHGARIALALISSEGTRDDYWLIRGRPFREDEPWRTRIRRELVSPFTVLTYRLAPDTDCKICGAPGATILKTAAALA